MTAATPPLREIEESPDLGITLPDGCRLSARVWRPVDAASDPVPAPLAITLELTTGDVGAALAVARAVRANGDTGRSARLAAMAGGMLMWFRRKGWFR